ncbi:MAG: hypothetical protein J6N49_05475 [Alphaproteobacteria bacterium]|nr:hypothetical protein [Alphaproteobacteria bacterium]
MKQQIIRRIKQWKRFYAAHTTEVDENSTWKDILLKLNLSYTDSILLGKQAVNKCEPFDFEELLYLGRLPYYQEIKNLMASMLNTDFGDYFLSRLPNGDDVYFVRYPSLTDTELTDNLYEVPIVVATVVYHHPVDFDEDIYIWCGKNYLYENICKHLIIRYADKKPDDFIIPSEYCNKEPL